MINDDKVFQEHYKKLHTFLEKIFTERIWIVVGYSGECDPVFDQIAEIRRFDNNLYWICFKDEDPIPKVNEKLFRDNKGAYYVKKYDADDFFVTLAQKLNCFPPDFIKKPIPFLVSCLNSLTSFTPPGVEQNLSMPEDTIKELQIIQETYEQSQSAIQPKIDIMGANYDKVIEESENQGKNIDDEDLAWAYMLKGNELFNCAKEINNVDTDIIFEHAYRYYNEAVKINSNMYEAFYNWGVALYQQAKKKEGKEADQLYGEACEKYAEAVRIKSDYHEACNNWGLVLCKLAEKKEGEETKRLYEKAYEKYAEAIRINPNKHESFYNWGIALCKQLEKKNGEEAGRLFGEACEKFAEVVRIKPDFHEVFCGWGIALYEYAKKKEGQEAEQLYYEACKKFTEVVSIKSTMHEAFYNWGIVLYEQAKKKEGKDAERLYSEACEKFEESLRIKPDFWESFGNLGLVLLYLAKAKNNELEKREYLNKSKEMLMESENIKPGNDSYNLACVSALEGNEIECQKWLENSLKYNKLLPFDHIMKDTDFDAMRDKPWFQEFLQKVK